MSEEARTEAKLVLPKSKKLYVWASVLYGFCAINDIRLLFWKTPSHSPYPPNWPWMNWIQIAGTVFCIWIFFKVSTAVSNRIEKAVCILTMMLLALGIPTNIRSLGYGWVYIPGDRGIDTTLISVAALLVFLRTFQVLRGTEAPTEMR
jgi:hypothetical protein